MPTNLTKVKHIPPCKDELDKWKQTFYASPNRHIARRLITEVERLQESEKESVRKAYITCAKIIEFANIPPMQKVNLLIEVRVAEQLAEYGIMHQQQL